MAPLPRPEARAAQELTLDPALTATLRSRWSATLSEAEERSDGRILILGGFDYIDGQAQAQLARLMPDGSLDLTFFAPETDRAITQIAVTVDGKTLLGGAFTSVNGVPRPGLARLNPDGDLDPSFAPANPGLAGLRDLIALPDGGYYLIDRPSGMTRVRRFDGNGQPVPGYTPVSAPVAVSAWAVGPNDEIALTMPSGSGGISVFDAAGTPILLNPAVPPDFNVSACVFDPDGALVLSGQTSPGPGPGLVRILTDGSLDPSFSGISPLPGGFGGSDLIRLASGGYVTVGAQGPGSSPPHVLQFNPQGGLQKALTVDGVPNGYPVNLDLASLGNGDYLLHGIFIGVEGVVAPSVARISDTGDVRPDFFADVLRRGGVTAIADLTSGGHLIAGDFTELGEDEVGNVAVLASDDAIGPALPYIPFGVDDAFATANGGAVLFGGFPPLPGTSTVGLVKLQGDGQVDTNFLAGVSLFGFETGTQLSDGAIILAGRFGFSEPEPPATNLVRVLPDGSIDPAFNNHSELTGGSAMITAVAADAAGRIIVAGRFASFQGVARPGLARTTPDGVVDPLFVPPVGLTLSSAPRKIVVLEDGRFYLIGIPTNAPIGTRPRLLRFNEDGTLDGTFPVGIPSTQAVSNFAVGVDGVVFVAIVTPPLAEVVALDPSGAIDPSFAATFDGPLGALTVDADGRLWVGGTFVDVNGERRESLARFSPPVPFSVAILGPGEVTVPLLHSVTFEAKVAGAPSTPTFQWYWNGWAIPRATGATLTIPHVLPWHAGNYTVRATAGDQQVVSEPVKLRIVPPGW